jgi:uncharacterized protein YjdB
VTAGSAALCIADSSDYDADGDVGGTWSSSNTGVATVNATTGMVTAVAAGTTTIRYIVTGSGGCANDTASQLLTVTAPPVAGTISGDQSLCIADTNTYTISGNSTAGTWESSDAAVASVDGVGLVTGLTAGTADIWYIVTGTGGCGDDTATLTVTITAPPEAGTLSGNTALCTLDTATFESTVTGGTWTSSNTSIATIGSSTGFASTLTAGSVYLRYTVTGTGGCANVTDSIELIVTAPPVAGTLSGNDSICSNSGTTTLSSTVPGGEWSSANESIATVDGTSGEVTGVAPGSVYIIYTVSGTGGCGDAKDSMLIVVTAAPVITSLTGIDNVCIGSLTTFTGTPSGGKWSSGDITIALIDSVTGLITPVASGIATMTYTLYGTGGCADVTDTKDVTVNDNPSFTASTLVSDCGADSVELGLALSDISGWNAHFSTNDLFSDTLGTHAYSNGELFVKVTDPATNCYSIDSFNVVMAVYPARPDTIYGTADACPFINIPGSSTNILTGYKVSAVPGATGYQWTVPDSIEIVNGQGTDSITVKFKGFWYSDTIAVVAMNAENCMSESRSFMININYAETPLRNSIIGPTNICRFIKTYVNPGDVAKSYPDTAQYSVYRLPNVTYVKWTLPSGARIVSGDSTENISVVFEDSCTGGNIEVRFGSNCNISAPRTYAIGILATSTPGAINTTSTNVCSMIGESVTRLFYVNKPINVHYYLWTLPPNVTMDSSTGDKDSVYLRFLNGFTDNTNKAIKVKAVSCDTSLDKSLTLTTTLPATPTIIYGPTNACMYMGGDSLVTYYTRKVSGAVGYIWEIPAGMDSITPIRPGVGENDTLVQVRFRKNFTNSYIRVSAYSDCDTSGIRSLLITKSNPAQPGSITGPAEVCAFKVTSDPDTFAVYKIRRVSTATYYQWVAPAGAQIISHPNGTNNGYDTVVHVRFDSAFTTGTLSVRSVNSCGVSAYRLLSLSIATLATPSVVTATPAIANVCSLVGANDTMLFRISAIAAASGYKWKMPSNAKIVRRGNTSIAACDSLNTTDTLIGVKFIGTLSTGSVLSVNAYSSCNTSALRTYGLNTTIPSSPAGINGPQNVASQVAAVQTVWYTVTDTVPGAKYFGWTVSDPSKMQILADSGTASVDSISIGIRFVKGSFTNGTITVRSYANCGFSGTVRSLYVYDSSFSSPTAVTGSTNVCSDVALNVASADTVTYTATGSGASKFRWILSDTAKMKITTTNGDSSVVGIKFISPFSSGTITIRTISLSGVVSTATKSLAVTTTAPATPSSLTGLSSVCNYVSSDSTNTIQYDAAGIGTSVFRWTVPANTKIMSANADSSYIQLWFKPGFSTGTLSVKSQGACGKISSLGKTLSISTAAPSAPSTLTGDTTSVCHLVGTNDTVRFEATGAGVDVFRWTRPSLTQIASANADSSIIYLKFLPGFVSGTLSVKSQGICGKVSGTGLSLVISTAAPVAPATLTGISSVCAYVSSNVADTVQYTATGTNVFVYRWTIPANTSIYSAAADSSWIRLRFLPGFNSGTLSVKSQGRCGKQSVAAKTLSITTAAPAAPSVINGLKNVCTKINGVSGNDTAWYDVGAGVSGADRYTWLLTTLSGGASIIDSTADGDTIVVQYAFGFTGGTLTARSVGKCGKTSTARSATLSVTRPAAPFTISGTTSICSFVGVGVSNLTYTCSAVTGATSYQWEVPSGASLISGQGTRTIVVNFATMSSPDTIRVRASNGCAYSLYRNLILTCSTFAKGAYVNQTPVESTETESIEAGVFPNPSQGEFTIMLKTNIKADMATIMLLDATGRAIDQLRVPVNPDGSVMARMSLKGIAPGIYNARYLVGRKAGTVKVLIAR